MNPAPGVGMLFEGDASSSQSTCSLPCYSVRIDGRGVTLGRRWWLGSVTRIVDLWLGGRTDVSRRCLMCCPAWAVGQSDGHRAQGGSRTKGEAMQPWAELR